jgi:tryptophan synthase alpha chain
MSRAPTTSAPAGHHSAIALRFAALQQQGICALMPFLMAGDPDLSTTAAALLALQANGADLIELGIPYSDPLADGPVIQAAASRALGAHTTPAAVLALLASLRGQLTIPVILFTYSNPLLNRGMETFCQQAAEAGAAGLVVPDLPLEEAEKLSPIAAERGLDLVLLVAPTTPPERMARIHATSRGFTYLVSVTGVTGVRAALEGRVEPLVRSLKQQGGCPVAVGFGISGPEQARQVRAWGADGAIVGSALVKVMADARAAGDDVAAAAGRFCAALRQGLDQA